MDWSVAALQRYLVVTAPKLNKVVLMELGLPLAYSVYLWTDRFSQFMLFDVGIVILKTKQ